MATLFNFTGDEILPAQLPSQHYHAQARDNGPQASWSGSNDVDGTTLASSPSGSQSLDVIREEEEAMQGNSYILPLIRQG